MKFFSPNKLAFVYAVRILLGCLIVWWTLDFFHDTKKLFALISVIVVTDPDFANVRTSMISRIVNTIIGCGIGLLFIYFTGIHLWTAMLAVTISVVISTSFRNYPSSWKLAPATVLIVMMPGIPDPIIKDAVTLALLRSGEVLYGSLIAFVLGWIFTITEAKKQKDVKEALKMEMEKKVPVGKEDHD
jgi:uncharacterized membrane protein YccC